MSGTTTTGRPERLMGLIALGVAIAGTLVAGQTRPLAQAAQTAPPLRPGEVLEGPEAARIDDYLSRLVPYGFSGAVLIAAVPTGGDWTTQGRVVLKKGYGLANRADETPYTVDMVSTIGSVTKQFTGAAILKLEEMGKLKTSDPISKYLPDVPADKAAITIDQLLSHTAGFSGDLGGSDDEAVDRDTLVARVLAAPLAYPPGEHFEYSNEGFSLAGAIVERVSGQGYEAFLREHLFLPADMAETGYLAPAWPLARLPIGYGPGNDDGWGRVYKRGWLPDGPGWYLRANGGMHSTLDDLYRWHLALESDRVLSAAERAKYLGGHRSNDGGPNYAYGWGITKSRRGGTVISHNGGNGFFFTDFRRYVDEGVVIIAMTNQPDIPAPQLAPRQLESLYFNDAPVVMPPTRVTVPDADRAALAGTYRSDAGDQFVVTATGDGLSVLADDPTLFGSLGPVEAPGGRFAEQEGKTMPLVEASARGEFRPIFDAFAFEGGQTFEDIAANHRGFWSDWRDEFGEFEGPQLLGTGIVQGDPAVTVRLRFQRGSVVMQYIWGPRRLAGFLAVPSRPVALVAESPRSWVFYDYRLPQLIRARFGAQGTLVVEAPNGPVNARKVGLPDDPDRHQR